MKIAIAGASGLIGSALVAHFEAQGHEVYRLVRGEVKNAERQIYWKPSEGKIDASPLAGMEVVINLAGENIGSGLWTEAKKERLLESRVQGTDLLARTIASLETKPKAFIVASGYSYYGNTGEQVVDESAPPGDFFLSDVVRRWEEASAPAAEAGVRVVNTRFGVVLSKKDGMLGKTLLIFKLGLGGKLGDGSQYISWVTLDDLVRAIDFVIGRQDLAGPVNVMAPNPVTNAEYTDTLGDLLNRPTLFRAPSIPLRIVLGQMAKETLLASCRAVPKRLTEAGFRFEHPRLREALMAVLARND